MLTNLEIYRRATTGEICTREGLRPEALHPGRARPGQEARDHVRPRHSRAVGRRPRGARLAGGQRAVPRGRRVLRRHRADHHVRLGRARPGTRARARGRSSSAPGSRPRSSRCAGRRAQVLPFFSLGACGAGRDERRGVHEPDAGLLRVALHRRRRLAGADPGRRHDHRRRQPARGRGLRAHRHDDEGGRAGAPAAPDSASPTRCRPGCKSQGHIAGNAAAADQFDMMEIGDIAEFKIDFDNLSKIAYMEGRGRTDPRRDGAGDRRLRGRPRGRAPSPWRPTTSSRCSCCAPACSTRSPRTSRRSRARRGRPSGCARSPCRRSRATATCRACESGTLRSRASDRDEPVRGRRHGGAERGLGRERRVRPHGAGDAPRPPLADGEPVRRRGRPLGGRACRARTSTPSS